MGFHDFEEHERLVSAATALDDRIPAMVLLAGDAGLRPGEVVGLYQTDVNFGSNRLRAQRQSWLGIVDTPKIEAGIRDIPRTRRLADLLRRIRHLRGEALLVQDDGRPTTTKALRGWLKRAQRRAQGRLGEAAAGVADPGGAGGALAGAARAGCGGGHG